jgi:undecaprenyl-diphosphatase
MSWWQALLAGVIQGITEFLPVSSSGHLVLFQALFGYNPDGGNLAFHVLLHLATLISVFVVFWQDIWSLTREFGAMVVDMSRGKVDFKSPERRFLLMIAIATLPALVAGGVISILGWSAILENIWVVAVMLLGTSMLMFAVDKLGKKGKYGAADAPLKSAWIVGAMQAVAILPGLSRSGSTIFGGLLGGFKKEFAVRFSFIMSIPIILAASVVEIIQAVRIGELGVSWVNLAIGFVAALVCGIFAIKLIKVLIKSDKFYFFGIYCLLASMIAFLIGFGVLGS